MRTTLGRYINIIARWLEQYGETTVITLYTPKCFNAVNEESSRAT